MQQDPICPPFGPPGAFPLCPWCLEPALANKDRYASLSVREITCTRCGIPLVLMCPGTGLFAVRLDALVAFTRATNSQTMSVAPRVGSTFDTRETGILGQEYRTYNQVKHRLRAVFKPDEIVLIKGSQCYGVYSTRVEAYRVGLAVFGSTPMLIRTIGEADDVPVMLPSVWL